MTSATPNHASISPEERYKAGMAARNPDTEPERLAELAEFPDPHCLEGAAANPSTPTEAVIKAASRRWPSSRIGAASNPECPVAVLGTLATDALLAVRLAVASHPNTPVDVLTEMMGEPNLHSGIAGNPSLPSALLRELMVNPNQFVEEALASNPRMAKKHLDAYSRSEHETTRAAVARNANTRAATLQRLHKDKHVSVRDAAYFNPHRTAQDI